MISWLKSIFWSKKEVRERKTSVTEMSAADKKDFTKGIVSTIVEGVKISMAALLSIFVPQYCPETKATCTLQDNFSNLTMFNEFVIVFNFITLFSFIILITVINMRETYFLKSLDYSKDKSYNSLQENLKEYPDIIDNVKIYNKRLYKWARITIIMKTLNVIFSSVLIFYYYYDGFKSVTTIISNVLLVSDKLYNLVDICKESIKDTLALSTNRVEKRSYNVIDPIEEQSRKSSKVELQTI